MGIIDKCGVRGDATLCVVIFILRVATKTPEQQSKTEVGEDK